MADSPMTLGEVLERLTAEGLLEASAHEPIAEHLAKREPADDFPWYVRVLIGVGAWFAAGFFIAFLSMADLVTWSGESLLPWGLGFVVVATLLRRSTRHTFHAQLALALSVAGHGMTYGGVDDLLGGLGWVALVAVLLCAAEYPLNRDWLNRFLSVLVAIALVVAWVVHFEAPELLHVFVFAEVVGIGVLFTGRRVPSACRPLAYALAMALPMTLLLTISAWDIAMPWWPSSVVLAAWLIWLYGWCAGEASLLRREPMVVAIVATALLGGFSNPGLLAAVGLLVLGYAMADPVLSGLGLAFVPTFIVAYYYDLDVGLDLKSWVLMGSGAVLLAVRWHLSRRPWAREGAAS